MPIRIPFESSDLVLSHREADCYLEPIGTRVVNLPAYGTKFNLTGPMVYANKDIWHANALSFNLAVSFAKYSCLTVNKLPHGGARIPPRSHRATLFLYLVPSDWEDVDELETTIPAVDFLLIPMEESDDLVDINRTIESQPIQEWMALVENIGNHFIGESDRYKKMADNKKQLTKKLNSKPQKRRIHWSVD
jgi:hypothetical protein